MSASYASTLLPVFAFLFLVILMGVTVLFVMVGTSVLATVRHLSQPAAKERSSSNRRTAPSRLPRPDMTDVNDPALAWRHFLDQDNASLH